MHADSYTNKPAGHEQNKKLADNAYQANLKKYQGDTNFLVLPGLLADKRKQRVEVTVERTGLNPNEPCEFMIVGENSEHIYEALMVSLAKPSAVHQAIQFIGAAPAEPMNPNTLLFWTKGNSVQLSVVKAGEAPIRLEQLLLDQRTEKTLREEGFCFTGSKWLPDPDHPGKKLYVADSYQPMAIVCLFNSPYAVLEVPYEAAKGDVYQNTSVNPEYAMPDGAMLTLVIERPKQEEIKSTKNLILKVTARTSLATNSSSGLERIKGLSFQLMDEAFVLNEEPSISSVMQALQKLDRKRFDHYLTVSFGDDVGLGAAQALAIILFIIDNERGIRIGPPPSGQIYYRAFTPDRDLLERDARLFHPWELVLSENAGVVSGKLILINSAHTNDASPSELRATEIAVAKSSDVIDAMNAETEQRLKSGNQTRPPVVMVFVPSSFKHGQLSKFLEPVLTSGKTIHIYLDQRMPPVPGKK